MVDDTGSGFYPASDTPPETPGFGPTLYQRLQSSMGRQVSVYVGDMTTPLRGVLYTVGSDYIEVHRTVNNAMEMVIIPLRAVHAII